MKTFVCTSCRRGLKAKDGLAGRVIRCPACRALQHVPDDPSPATEDENRLDEGSRDKRCQFCGAKIPADAVVCRACKKTQVTAEDLGSWTEKVFFRCSTCDRVQATEQRRLGGTVACAFCRTNLRLTDALVRAARRTTDADLVPLAEPDDEDEDRREQREGATDDEAPISTAAAEDRPARHAKRFVVGGVLAGLVLVFLLMLWGLATWEPTRPEPRSPEAEAPGSSRQVAGRDAVPESLQFKDGEQGRSALPPDPDPTAIFRAGRARQSAAAKEAATPLSFKNSIGTLMVYVPPGRFPMGSSVNERGHNYDEGPQHEVTLTKGFHLASHEVTREQFGAFRPDRRPAKQRKTSPAEDHLPVARVTWSDAVAFCRWLSVREKRTYCLPTEAQWEYACRADTTTPYYWGHDPKVGVSWCVGHIESADRPAGTSEAAKPAGSVRVGRRRPNAWGLYDMHGNVWEWCSDWYRADTYTSSPRVDPTGPTSTGYRVARGGSWLDLPASLRSAVRLAVSPGKQRRNVGFRVACLLHVPWAETAVPELPDRELPPRKAPAAEPAVEPPGPALTAERARELQADAADRAGLGVRTRNSLGMVLCYVPPGTFMMGSPRDRAHSGGEAPRHRVTLSRGFYMSACEVTNGHFREFDKSHSSGKHGKFPLEQHKQPAARVTWNDAVAFCDWLSQKEKERTYRLPTEAEWEYACRAGTTTTYPWGDLPADGKGHCNAKDRAYLLRVSKTGRTASFDWDDGSAVAAAVGSGKPNPWGLSDMLGNVWEWCHDYYSATYYARTSMTDPTGPPEGSERTLRGGSWLCGPAECRPAHRWHGRPALRDEQIGFRVVCDAPHRAQRGDAVAEDRVPAAPPPPEKDDGEAAEGPVADTDRRPPAASCIELTGDGCVELGLPRDVFDGPCATYEVWIRPASNAHVGHVIWDGNEIARNDREIIYYAGKIALDFTSDPSLQLTSGHEAPAKCWSHVAVVIDKARVRLYVNGQLTGPSPDKVGPHRKTSAVYLGRGRSAGRFVGHQFRGRITAVTLWRRLLSAEEIAASAKGAAPADSTGRIGYWDFSKGSFNATYGDHDRARSHGAVRIVPVGD